MSVRVKQTSTDFERKAIDSGRNHLIAELELEQHKHKHPDDFYSVYQKKTAKQLCEFFINPSNIWACVIALTQSGKTRLIHCFIYMFIQSYTISYKNIFIITGHSSKEWKRQTKDRFPDLIERNILHRQDLQNEKIRTLLKNIKNALIIIDECHVAAQPKQTINTLFNDSNIKEEYGRRDIKIVCISATPNGIGSDIINNLNQGAGFFVMKPGDSYHSIFQKLDDGKVFEAKELSGRNCQGKQTDGGVHLRNQVEILDIIKKIETPKYHLIRLQVGIRYDFCKQEFENHLETMGLDFEIKEYTDKQEIRIDDIVCNKPIKHTLVFIKEKLRCAKSVDEINKMRHIGSVYDRRTKQDDVANQGLAGRTTGYDINRDIIVFTRIPSIQRYRALWNLCLEGKFDEANRLQWSSSTTNKKGTYMSHEWVGIHRNIENNVYIRECKILIFNNMKFAQKFMKNLIFYNPYNDEEIKLYGRVTNRKKITTEDGNEFYCDSLRKQKNLIPRSFEAVIDQIEKKHVSSKKKNGQKIFHQSNYFAGYLKPPKLENGKWVGGNNKTLRIVIPLPLLCNYYHDSIPLLENLYDYKDYMTKELTVVQQNYNEEEFIEYMQFINNKYNIKLEYVDEDDDDE